MNPSLIVLFLWILHFCFSCYGQCVYNDAIGRYCKNVKFQPDLLLVEDKYDPKPVAFLQMIDAVDLAIPPELENKTLKYAFFSSFKVRESSVKSIGERFFEKLDRGKKLLKTIEFSNIRSLKSLNSISFEGIGRFLQVLKFENLHDLITIDSDFFDSFSALKTLHISNTKLTVIQNSLFSRLVRLEEIVIDMNQLTEIPYLTAKQFRNLSIFRATGNPLFCRCELMPIVRELKEVTAGDLSCGSPEHLKGQSIFKVGDLCVTTTERIILKKITTAMPLLYTISASIDQKSSIGRAFGTFGGLATFNTKGQNDVKSGLIKLEILITAAVVILVILVVIIVVVLRRRQVDLKKRKKRNPICNPSIISKEAVPMTGHNSYRINQLQY